MALYDGTWIECSLLTGWLRALRERSCNTPHKGMPIYKGQGAGANLWSCLTRYQQPANKLLKEWSEPAADFGPLPPPLPGPCFGGAQKLRYLFCNFWFVEEAILSESPRIFSATSTIVLKGTLQTRF